MFEKIDVFYYPVRLTIPLWCTVRFCKTRAGSKNRRPSGTGAVTTASLSSCGSSSSVASSRALRQLWIKGVRHACRSRQHQPSKLNFALIVEASCYGFFWLFWPSSGEFLSRNKKRSVRTVYIIILVLYDCARFDKLPAIMTSARSKRTGADYRRHLRRHKEGISPRHGHIWLQK